MGGPWAQVIPLALGAAVSPLLFTVQLATLTGPRRLARGLAVTLGAAIPVIVVSAAALLFGRALRLPQASPRELATIDFVLAGILFALVVRMLVRGPKPPPDPREHPARQAGGAGKAFVLGLGAMATNVSTFALLLPAMKFIAEDHISVADRVTVAAVVVLIVLIPAIVPLVLTAVMPSASARVLDGMGIWMRRHHRGLGIVICLGFGAFLVVHGFSELAKG